MSVGFAARVSAERSALRVCHRWHPEALPCTEPGGFGATMVMTVLTEHVARRFTSLSQCNLLLLHPVDGGCPVLEVGVGLDRLLLRP